MPTGIGRAITSPVIGFLSVLMGIGGGSFGVPLMRLYGVPIHRAVGTASGFGLLIAVPSVAGFLLHRLGPARQAAADGRHGQPAGVPDRDRHHNADDAARGAAGARHESHAA